MEYFLQDAHYGLRQGSGSKAGGNYYVFGTICGRQYILEEF